MATNRNMQHPHSISEESLGNFLYGQVTAGETAVPLSHVTGQYAAKYVKIKPLAANTGKVYVGDLNVTANNGYELAPGAELELKVYDLTSIYVIGSAAGQVVSWISV
jgi:hypothetical protein